MEKTDLREELNRYLEPGKGVSGYGKSTVEEVISLVSNFLETRSDRDLHRLEESLLLDTDYDLEEKEEVRISMFPCYKVDPFDSRVIKNLMIYFPHCETECAIFILLPNGNALEVRRIIFSPRLQCFSDSKSLLEAIKNEIAYDEDCRQDEE